uniref:Uncharacterized protein n=1 Tax=Anguilla anguilla TaxID=7936 RepID=A0A0E9VGF3_ANGAN
MPNTVPNQVFGAKQTLINDSEVH